MIQTHSINVVAVVVTYRPDFEILEQLLDALIPQVKTVVIVDNGSFGGLESWIKKRMTPALELLFLHENFGIAAAHNVGIKWALDSGAEFVLLMDQDSIPALGMVQKLAFALLNAEKHFDSPAIAAGPVCIDSRNGNSSFCVTALCGIPSRWWPLSAPAPNIRMRKVTTLISSGTLIDLKVFQEVGGMRSNYFIDHVDTEWCFRVKTKGFLLLGVPDAIMKHTLGDKVRNIWFFGWRPVAHHSPLRDYYMFRNTLLMCRDVKISVVWQLYLILRLFKFLIYFLTFTSQRVQRFHYMMLGIAHGLRSISGKLDLKTSHCTQIPKSNLDP